MSAKSVAWMMSLTIGACGALHSQPPLASHVTTIQSEGAPRCDPVSSTTRRQRLRRTSSFSAVNMRAPDGDVVKILFDNSPESRAGIKKLISGPSANGSAFSEVEIERLSSEVTASQYRFKFDPSDEHSYCVGVARVLPGKWEAPSYLADLLVNKLQPFSSGAELRRDYWGFRPGHQPTCEDIAALLRCDLFVTRDDYSGHLVISIN